jgi:hypothetical protein
MRRPSRWIAATAGAALTVAVAATASDARHRQRVPVVRSHAPPAVQTVRVPQEPPPPGAYAVVGTTEGRADSGQDKPSAVVLDSRDVQAILGKGVRSSAGEDMGRLVDVVVDRDGQPRAAIIDFGGFLGVGSRKIAVDWAALKFLRDDSKGNVVTVELTRDQVKAAPEFKEGSPVVILGALGSAPQTPPSPASAQEPSPPKPQEPNSPKPQEK